MKIKHKKHEREKKIDDSAIDEIKKLAKTLTTQEISDHLQVPRTTLINFLKKNDIIPLKKLNPLYDYTIDLFIKQFNMVKSIRKVGQLNGVSDNAIRKWLKKNNISPRKSDLEKYLNI